jgi:REP element-mobilizing transposase RayT/predicted DNA-binding protein YlxM (UPF0122 family)
MIRGINKESIFKKIKYKKILKGIIEDKIKVVDVKIYGYCIMDNHLHLLIMAEISQLAQFMSRLNTSFARYYNCQNERVGHVFQNRFKSECIDTKSYFWSCLRYIHLNPVKAKMIDHIKQYYFSSFNEYINPKKEDILCSNAIKFFKANFIDKEEFIEFHHAYSECIFLDVKEDINIYKREIAEHIISDIQFQFGYQDKFRIFQNSNSNKELKKKLKETLQISAREVEEIIKVNRDV